MRGDPRPAARLAASCCAALLLVACSSGEDDGGGTAPTAPTGATADATGPTATGPAQAVVQATVEVGNDPIGIASGEGSLWVVNAEIDARRGTVSRIDPASDEVLETVDVGAVPLEVAVGEGSVWVSNSGDNTVTRINPSSNDPVAGIDTCGAPEGIAIGAGSVWVVCEDDSALAQIDPATDEIVDEIEVGLQPRFATFAFDSVWVSNYLDGTITRIDPSNGEVLEEITTEQGPQIMVEADGLLWVSCTDVDVVQAIDPESNEIVAIVETPIAPDGLAFDGTTLWVATESGPELAGIDPAAQEVVTTVVVADEGVINANQVMAYEDGSLWLPLIGQGTVLRRAARVGNPGGSLGRRDIVRLRPLLATIGLLLATACANGSSTPPGSTAGSGPAVYGGNVFVLDEPDRDPVACFGAVAESLPPQCQGIPIVGWDWSVVEGEETASNTTWGFFHVVGTYDGSTFEVQEAGPPTTEGSSRDPVDTPCPEPDGGWTSPDLSKASDRDLVALMRAVEEEPDFAGFWIDYVVEPAGEAVVEPGGIIANVAFTGDVETRSTLIRELWGGPLCLVRHERTYEELSRIQRELSGRVGVELGLEVTGSGVSQHDNVVEVGVVVADPEAVAAVEARYGPGAVLLDPTLWPIPA